MQEGAAFNVGVTIVGPGGADTEFRLGETLSVSQRRLAA